ncbi:MAG TPA: hypothetical protein VFU88_09030 [Ktedonobacterales bacterium]|nr:hypothetical protein [Ktedonobacterales bacterium]
MDQRLPSGDARTDTATEERQSATPNPHRCSICRRRLGRMLFFVEETGDVPEPRGSWALCERCNEAVHVQMEQSPVRSPLRLRVAVGLVAAERTPEARRARFGQLTDDSWVKVFLWLLPITMIIHLAIIVLIAGIAK